MWWRYIIANVTKFIYVIVMASVEKGMHSLYISFTGTVKKFGFITVYVIIIIWQQHPTEVYVFIYMYEQYTKCTVVSNVA